MIKNLFKFLFHLAMLSSIAMMAFAEEAPVYDVDSAEQQFDGQQQGRAIPSRSPAPEGAVEQERPRSAPAVAEQQPSPDSADSAQVDSLQKEVQTLRGQVEELTHQLQQVQTQQKAMYSDLDKRVSNSKGAAADKNKAAPAPAAKKADEDSESASTDNADAKKTETATADSTTTAKDSLTNDQPEQPADVSQPDVAEEQQIYQTAYNLIKAKKYGDAVDALKKMLAKYPSGQFAANAHYWLGELYDLMGKKEEAAAEYAIVVKKFPDGAKAADAQLKIGLIYVSQSKLPEAKAIFKKVISQYPGSSSARLASDQLKQLKRASR